MQKKKKVNYICNDFLYLRHFEHKLWQFTTLSFLGSFDRHSSMNVFQIKKVTSSKIPPPLRGRALITLANKGT